MIHAFLWNEYHSTDQLFFVKQKNAGGHVLIIARKCLIVSKYQSRCVQQMCDIYTLIRDISDVTSPLESLRFTNRAVGPH